MHAIRRSRAVTVTAPFLALLFAGIVQAAGVGAATAKCSFSAGDLTVSLRGNDETFSLADEDGDGLPGVALASGCGGASYDDLISLTVKGSARIAETTTFVQAGDTEWADFATTLALGPGADAEDTVRLEGEDIAAGGVYSGDTILADSFATYSGVEMVEVYGFDGNDVLFGATLIRNHLDGGPGVDLVAGGSLDDVIHGGDTPEPDDLYGGSGDDVFVECKVITGGDAMTGGDGSDTVDYSGRTAAVTVTLPEVGSYTSGNGEALENDGFDSIENVITGSGSDTITGSAVANVISAGSGADVIAGGDGADVIEAGPGTDQSSGDGGDDRFLEGSDDGASDTIVGGDGYDVLDYSGRSSQIEANLAGPSGEDHLYDGQTFEEVIGTAYGDTITARDSGSTLRGRGGADVLNGRGGADVLVGGTGLDFLNAGSGADVLDGSRDAAIDLYAAGDGIDVCFVESPAERDATCESYRGSRFDV